MLTAIVSPEKLQSFLLNPNSYPHRPRSVRWVQTHASSVFLAPPFVFKVKKAVNLGFLDFSTLAQRRYFCEREVALNRRLCSDVYLGVVPISTRRGRLTFGPGDTVVEYAIKMRKLSDRYFLDRLLERRKVGLEDLDRIIAVLKRFYEAQHPTREIENWGRMDRLRISTDENFRQTERFVGRAQVGSFSAATRGATQPETDGAATLSRPAFETIRFYTDQFYRRHSAGLASRVREKWIRDCHGDLHLNHIYLTPRAVQIYDCIEFNDRFRYVDVANDAAFLAMDLDYEGRPDLGRYFATGMAAALHDEKMPFLMDFYKCYRAYVRGKVESLHGVAPAVPEAEREASAERARRYFRLALQYTVAGSQPLVLVVMGRIASGKSTLARALGAELGWDVYSSDSVRKKIAGVPLYQRGSAAGRKRLYSTAVTRQTYDRLFRLAEAHWHQGRSVILDATFGRREQREWLARRWARLGITWRFLEAQASDASVKQRLRLRDAQSEEVSDARLEDFAKLTRRYESPTELSSDRFIKVRTSLPLEPTLTQALRSLTRFQLMGPARGSERRVRAG